MSDERFAADILKRLLGATHEYYSYVMSLREKYENELKKVASGNPLTKINEAAGFGTNSSAALGTSSFVLDAAYFPPNLLSIKKPKKPRIKPYKKESAMAKAELKRIEKLLMIKPPVTQSKLVKLMGIANVPVEKFVAQRVDVLIRKYLTTKLKEFTDETFKRVFFTGTPPFSVANKVNVSWEKDMKGLMKTAMDVEGMVVKRPTERLTAIIKYCNEVVNGAYRDLDDHIPGQSVEAVFVNRVATFNGYTLFINNISQNLRYNASSLIFTYFHRTSPKIKFSDIFDTLSDIRYGSTDAEKVLLNYAVNPDIENTDEAVKDPYNIVTFAGHPYDQVRPALRAEFVLLKLLFYLSKEFGRHIKAFIDGTYKRKFDQIDIAAFSVNNVLQLCPGLMTLMFYMINLSKDKEGIAMLNDINHKFRVISTLKGHAGRQEGIELQKSISQLMENITVKCIDLLMTKTIAGIQIIEYANLLFIRSGLLKDAGSNMA